MSETLPLPTDADEQSSANGDQLEDLHRVVDEALVAIHFQPIVNLSAREIFAYEALCRPQSDSFKGPQELIEAATAAGRIGELGRLNRSIAVDKCPGSPLFVNIDPHEFDQPWLVRPDDPIFRHKRSVYLEITETVPLKFFEHCHGVLAELRKKGALLAIDDLGAGFSNLKYIADLEPDIVKLDRDLVRGCEEGSREFGLLKSITRLCHEMQAKVIAEGVETVDELKAVLAAEVDYAQGYLLARPEAPPPAIRWPTELRWSWRPAAETQAAPEEPPEEEEASEPVSPAAVYIEVPTSETEANLHRETQELSDKLKDSESQKSTLTRRLKMMTERVDRLHRHLEELSASKERPAEQLKVDLAELIPATTVPTQPATTTTVRTKLPPRRSKRKAVMVLLPLLLVTAASGFLLVRSRGSRPPSSPNKVVSSSTPAVPAAEPTSTNVTSMALPDSSKIPTAELAARTAPSTPESAIESSDGPPPVPVETTASPTDRGGNIVLQATAVINQVNSWARAWSDQRVADYLSSYARSFEPPDGMSRGAWEAQRRQRLLAPTSITVALRDLEVTFPSPDLARATFLQSYKSPTFGDETRKTLELVWEDGDWQIAVEQSDDP
jgi:EAL domain-containing protein (putative c-di-GMP-specific phosphodiesterase class I)